MTDTPTRAADFDPAALTGRVSARLGERSAVSVSGPDAESYLQGQLSQDIAAIAASETAHALVLQPQGKIDAWLRVTRLAEDRFVLDVDRHAQEVMLARLKRFLLRTDAVIEPLDWVSLSLRGADSATIAQQLDAAVSIATPGWAGGGIDLFGPELVIPDGVSELSDEVWAALRIVSGVPAMGSELDEDTIPAAAGIVDDAVSFTKGCYTGQELVARIDSRGGNVPRRLRFFVVDGDTPPVGAEFIAEDKASGHVTSVAQFADSGLTVGLGYVARRIEIPADGNAVPLTVTWAGVSTEAKVSALSAGS